MVHTLGLRMLTIGLGISLMWGGGVRAAEAPAAADVCFSDFRISYVIGKSETEIGQPYFCLYTIERAVFLKLLSPRPASEFYMPGYARAKITMGPDDVYFIDNNAVVRHGDQKFAIDKMAFTRALKQVRKPPPASQVKPCRTGCGKGEGP